MKKLRSKFFSVFLAIFLVFGIFTLPSSLIMTDVSAQDDNTNFLCDLIPFLNDLGLSNSICGTGDIGEQSSDNLSTAGELVRFGLSLIFIIIIAIAIFTIIRAAIQYIRSEGEEEKIQESNKAIKAVFIGIGALLVGIIGLVVILAFFNASISDAEVPDQLTPLTDPITGE